ncbi:hypothetical protein BOTCAL_0327g00030 [Botryotinia calthae]|uniref:Uncharacterized protein n=1 Tax=Botryotinia calthae TaxID=38488 RepID=A0A4Y8CVZ0_9HELO|nr:hypothetical protein BOTCAL_0327g00030 [Botryotinia calthae]
MSSAPLFNSSKPSEDKKKSMSCQQSHFSLHHTTKSDFSIWRISLHYRCAIISSTTNQKSCEGRFWSWSFGVVQRFGGIFGGLLVKETQLSTFPKEKSTCLDVDARKPTTFSLDNQNDHKIAVHSYNDNDDAKDRDRDQKLKRADLPCEYKLSKEDGRASSQ